MTNFIMIAKWLVIGIIGGLLYGFTSFFLITPCLRGNIVTIIFFGFQGLLFVIVFLLLRSNKIILWNYIDNSINNTIVGALSGLLSGSFNIIITYINFIESSPVNATGNLLTQLSFELIYYSIGCIVIGSTIGYIVGRVKESESRPQHNFF